MKNINNLKMFSHIYRENSVTKLLDNALSKKENCMVSGPTGYGKTSMVQSWLVHNEDKINAVWFDASDLCYRVKKCRGMHFKDDLTLAGRLFTDEELDAMQKPNTVVVVDDYQDLDYNGQQHVLLLCDRMAVVETEDEEYRKMDNIMFVCLIERT